MALVGLSEAAKLTGRNQTTIHRAMKAGRLSCTVDETGSRRIDTAELDRVFGIKNNGAILDAMAQPVQSHVAPVREIELLNRLLDDAEAEERRRLTMLLADQRPAATPPAAELPRSAWRRFLAWRR